MNAIPGWTILAYLDGNGELEPEIAAEYCELKAAAINGKPKVLLQIGRLKQSTVQLIRPDAKPDQEIWDGVRRYQFNTDEEIPPEDLGDVNLADPNCLYDFLLWGLKNTNTKHVMLILGGHACEYIGLMNDYSGKYPAIMGIPELVTAIEMAANAGEHAIDLLLMDACYCNNIETLYEFGYREDAAVKLLITYRQNANAAGISFRELLKAVGESNVGNRPKELANKICSELSADLVARVVQSKSLRQLKRLFDSLARRALSSNVCIEKDLSTLFSVKAGENKFEWNEAERISHIVSDLTISPKTKVQNTGKDIGILDQYIPNQGLASFYYRLAFARDNAWAQLLCSQIKEKNYTLLVTIGFSPLLIPEAKVRGLIKSCNPYTASFLINVICSKLIDERKWDKHLFPNIYLPNAADRLKK
ncbi:clostripain-related cysteine peptidase [Caproicibacterium sp. BJN0003]|uniref:clostripain-related cysteine peptidase n=1 Tax=Caproicibacterium sp. BJN0003 TaxID=2994078 RepID=UPI0022567A51|nr:clostripain-related cysteine peptidase [Caproicibacterium sp. BJN0003]UZT82746.1 clostripain-related cysteine peptidase [Caproicibacterium sp. BJN0003]